MTFTKINPEPLCSPTHWVDRIIVTALEAPHWGQIHWVFLAVSQNMRVQLLFIIHLWAVPTGLYSLKVDIKRAFSAPIKNWVPATHENRLRIKTFSLIKVHRHWLQRWLRQFLLKAGLPEGSHSLQHYSMLLWTPVMNRFHEKVSLPSFILWPHHHSWSHSKEAWSKTSLSILDWGRVSIFTHKTQTIPVHNRVSRPVGSRT